MRRGLLFSTVVLSLAPSGAGAQDTTPSTLDTQIKEQQLRQITLTNDEQQRATAAAKSKSVLDALPASTTTGAVATKDGAGQAEASALASRTLVPLADLIGAEAVAAARASPVGAAPAQGYDCASAGGAPPLPPPGVGPGAGEVAAPVAAPLGGPPVGRLVGAAPAPAAVSQILPTPPVLLTAGSDQLGFGHWDQFKFRYCKIRKDYDDAISAASSALKPRGPVKGGNPLVELAVSAAVKLAQLVTPDWEVSNLKVDPSNRALLLEVGRAYREASATPCPALSPSVKGAAACIPVEQAAVYWQGATGRINASSIIFADLGDLDGLNRNAQSWLEKVTAAMPKATSPSKKGAKGKKPKVAAPDPALAAKITSLKASLDAVIAAHAQLIKDLAGTDAAGPLPLGVVISEASTAELLGDDGLVLNVNVDSTGGTGLARKVIWNAFSPGSPFFYVSGTTSVSYALVRPSDQRLIASRTFSCSTGPVRLKYIPAVLRVGGRSLNCDRAR